MRLALISLALLLAVKGCATASPAPRDVADGCTLAAERPHWIAAAVEAGQRRGVPPATILAIIWRESRFVSRAAPPRDWALGIVPMGRKSSAYGFAQAIDGTWDWYREAAKRPGADRTRFSDAADFVGWYMNMSARKLGLPMGDARAHYLAYHEGHGGYRRGSWREKTGVRRAAREVAERARLYDAALRRCDAGYAKAVTLAASPLPPVPPFGLRVAAVMPLPRASVHPGWL